MKGVDLKIICLLAEETEYCQYDMPQALGVSYRTVMRRLRELQGIGLVKVARRERSKKRGKRRKIYTLTFKGVVTYLTSISLKPISLYAVVNKTREDVLRRIKDDILRYEKEASQLAAFLEFYGKQLDYMIFKKIRWLSDHFPMKTENPILSAILEVSKMTKSFFSSSGLSKFIRGLMNEKTRLKKQKRLFQKYPSLRRMSLFTGFGPSRKEEEIDLYEETKARFQRLERDLDRSLELENEKWKLWFAERFFERIAYFPSRGNTHDKDLHRFANELLEGKKRREISKLEKAVDLFHAQRS